MVLENNFWKISGTHDGYLIKFGAIYERQIEFYPEQMKFIGYDKLFRKNPNKENQNIFISGMNNEKEQIIKWEISKL